MFPTLKAHKRLLSSIAIASTAIAAGTLAPAASVAAADDDYTSQLQMGTANPGGGYFSMGTEYSNILEKSIDVDGLRVTAIETGGSVDNLAKIGRGQLQLGLAQFSTAMAVIHGKGKFKDADVESVRLIGCLEPYALHAITIERTGIDSLSDAANKRVAIGAPGSANQLASRQLLSAYGFGEDDYTALAEASDDARSKLQDGNLDIVLDIQTIPFPGLQQIQAATGEARLLPIDPEPLETLLASGDFAQFEIPADAYDFTDESITTISDWSCMFASKTQVSPDLGYALTKAVYEQADQLTMPGKKHISLSNALPEGADLPLHPGAEKYFRENGVIN